MFKTKMKCLLFFHSDVWISSFHFFFVYHGGKRGELMMTSVFLVYPPVVIGPLKNFRCRLILRKCQNRVLECIEVENVREWHPRATYIRVYALASNNGEEEGRKEFYSKIATENNLTDFSGLNWKPNTYIYREEKACSNRDRNFVLWKPIS